MSNCSFLPAMPTTVVLASPELYRIFTMVPSGFLKALSGYDVATSSYECEYKPL